MLMTTVSEF